MKARKFWNKHIRRCFHKANVSCCFSVGIQNQDGFAPLLKEGQITNVRLYLWDKADVKRLQQIANELQNGS